MRIPKPATACLAVLLGQGITAPTALAQAPVGGGDAGSPVPATELPQGVDPSPAQPPLDATDNVSPAPVVECIPTCRDEFVCAAGRCVSPCNPPCAAGQICAEGRVCRVPVPPPPPPGSRTHDGFYFRAGLGLGVVGGDVAGPDVEMEVAPGEGMGFALDLGVGLTPIRGVAVGLGAFFSIGFDSTGTGAGEWATGRVEVEEAPIGGIGAVMLGPFVDVYPDAGSGLHFVGAFGPVSLSWSKPDAKDSSPAVADPAPVPPVDYGGSGFGFIVGGGYEWWIGKEWSLGGLVRIGYASGSVEPREGGASAADLSVVSTGFLVNVTCH